MKATWLGDVLHSAGLKVVPMDGWLMRGAPMSRIDAVVCHGTITPRSASDEAVARILRDGHSTLNGPLSQLGLDRLGRFWLVAAGKCNHNGPGMYSNQTIGIEAFHDGKEEWPGVQLDAWHRGCAAIAKHLALPVNRVLGHKETDPNRKVDPAFLNMEAFRRAVAAHMQPKSTPQEDLLMAAALDDDDARRTLVRLWCWQFWGMAPTVEEQNILTYHFGTKGADLTLAAITDHDKARNRAA